MLLSVLWYRCLDLAIYTDLFTLRWNKTQFYHFTGLSVVKNCLRPESAAFKFRSYAQLNNVRLLPRITSKWQCKVKQWTHLSKAISSLVWHFPYNFSTFSRVGLFPKISSLLAPVVNLPRFKTSLNITKDS